jgi:gliding motility-associated-like protein
LRITPTVGQRFSAFNWLADADIANPGLANQVFSSLPARWVYLQLTDTSGCTYLDSIWLQPRITVTANGGPDRFVCGPDSIVLTARGGTSYLWSTGDTTASIQVYTNTSRVYWVETRIGNCKSLPDSILVSYRPIEADFAFTPDTAYAPQEVAFQNLSFPDENLRFTWDFGDGASSSMPNPIHVYRQPGFYRIVLKVVNPITGCSDSLVYEYLFVDSIQIMLPNAFTPNGDGTNDVYTGVMRNLRDVDFRIYDRWGGLVFRSIQPEIAWNGNSNGSICQPGVYPYVLEAKGKNGRPYQLTGQIILIR